MINIGDTVELTNVVNGKKETFTIIPSTREYPLAELCSNFSQYINGITNTDHDLSKGEIESESKLAQILIGKELNQVIINKDENGIDSEYRITNVIYKVPSFK